MVIIEHNLSLLIGMFSKITVNSRSSRVKKPMIDNATIDLRHTI